MVELSRNNFFYVKTNLNDNFETRALLILFHLAIILKTKKSENLKSNFQKIFDNIFQNIEYNIRELGYGDTSVNKNMKSLNKIFYDIIFTIEKEKNFSFVSNNDLLNKYFNTVKKSKLPKIDELAQYFDNFQNFCFDLDVNNVLNGSIDFKYIK